MGLAGHTTTMSYVVSYMLITTHTSYPADCVKCILVKQICQLKFCGATITLGLEPFDDIIYQFVGCWDKPLLHFSVG